MILTCEVYDLVSRYLEISKTDKIDVGVALELSLKLEENHDNLYKLPSYLEKRLSLISNWADYLVCYNASRIAKLPESKLITTKKDIGKFGDFKWFHEILT